MPGKKLTRRSSKQKKRSELKFLVGEPLRVHFERLTLAPRKGTSGGVHASVKTDKEEIAVHLGPSFFLENQDVKIAAKDKVEVKGSRVTFDGKPAIIAMELRKGDEMLKLRDDAGYPVWSAWRRH